MFELPFKSSAFPWQKALRIVNILLAVSIFFSGLWLTRDIIISVFLKKNPQTAFMGDKIKTAPVLRTKDIMNYAGILEKNPFGSPMKLIPLTSGYEAKGAGSPASLILVGTVAGPKNLSYAIFEDKSQSRSAGQEVFAYGKNVYNYGILSRIEKGWVELKQGANTYKIPVTEIRITEMESKAPGVFAQKVGEKEYILDQKRIQEALNTPEQILTDARLLPNLHDGRQEGFTLSEVKTGGMYDSLGLRNGDVLLRVNRLEISSPDAAMQAMSALKGMDRVNLDVIRNGSRMTMTYQVK
ncbi:MAG: hypothetical protein HZA10_01460 [Nitrospirae bacterium]|nr:hypothetical protein [Nitrospirota bacterium]